MDDIQQFAQQVKDKYGLETFDLSTDRAGNIELVMLQVPRDSRQQGAGAAAMKALTDYADRTGALIWLSVADRDSKTGTTSRGRLVKFYRRFGFVPNKGRNKRFELSLYAGMYRDPKGVSEEINDIRRRAGLSIRENQQQYPPMMDADQIFDYVSNIHHTPEDIHEGDVYERIQSYGEYRLVDLPMGDVDHQEWAIDDDMVDDYVAQTRTEPNYPPIVFDPIAKSIIDGTHRANALHQLGAKTIKAYTGVPQTARSWEEINSLMGMDDIDEELETIRRRAGLRSITETVEKANVGSGKQVNLIVNPNKKDLDAMMQMVVKKLGGRRPPDGSHVKGFYNPTMQTVWIWDGTVATHGEVGSYLIEKYGWPETEDWMRASGEPDTTFQDEEEGGYIPIIIDVRNLTSMKYEWWVPNENVFNEPAVRALEPVPYDPQRFG